MVSKVPWVVLKPFSSASVPKISVPPGFGVALETPFGWLPVLVPDAPEFEPELQAARRPPEEPMAARPTPVAAPRAKNERRSIRSDMFPLWTGPPTSVAGARVMSLVPSARDPAVASRDVTST